MEVLEQKKPSCTEKGSLFADNKKPPEEGKSMPEEGAGSKPENVDPFEKVMKVKKEKHRVEIRKQNLKKMLTQNRQKFQIKKIAQNIMTPAFTQTFFQQQINNLAHAEDKVRYEAVAHLLNYCEDRKLLEDVIVKAFMAPASYKLIIKSDPYFLELLL